MVDCVLLTVGDFWELKKEWVDFFYYMVVCTHTADTHSNTIKVNFA